MESQAQPDTASSRPQISSSAPSLQTERPIFVDLDGTLIATDLLHEGFVRAVRRTPSIVLKVPGWISQGLATLKQHIAQAEPVDAASLPYRESLVAHLMAERARGRPIILATASPEQWAKPIAEYLGCFDGIIASDATHNRKSSAKLAAIREWCAQHGHQGFDYYGDSAADRKIWSASRVAYLVGTGTRFRRELSQQGIECQEVAVRTGSLKTYIKALRPHQWAKNILIFAPMLLSHVFTDATKLFASTAAFVAFSLCASAVYVLNDLLDIDNDRRHPTKCRRPLAAGLISIPNALVIAAALLATTVAITATCLSGSFAIALGVYFAVTSAYSVWLKRLPLVDVFCLAGLYTSRLIAGGIATETPVSEWLLTLSVFLFTSLAFAKRYSELGRLETESAEAASGRGYLVSDISIIETLGPTCGYLAVLVMALYINSDFVKRVYAVNWPLWLMCPLLMYWITRVWFLAKRKILSEDPVIFAIKDNVSRAIAVMVGALFLISVAASKGYL